MLGGVRARTTVVAAVLVLVTLAIAGAALVASQRKTLTDNVDEVLARQNATIVDLVDAGHLTKALPGQGDDEAFAQVLDLSGAVVAATANSPGGLDLERPPVGTGRFQSLDLAASSGQFRVLSRRHGAVVIVTATPLDDVTDSAAALKRDLAVAVPAVAILLAGLVWLLVGRVLRPVEKIRQQVADISGSNLDRRVPQPTTRDEIARLAETMNGMLGRLESSADRQRRFVADAAHELRSPLTRIRAEVEVDLAQPHTADIEVTRRTVLQETATLQWLIDDMLQLARSDEEVLSEDRGEVLDLDDLVMREAQHLIATQPVLLDVSEVSAAQVRGSGLQLSRAVRNLLENAWRHGGPHVRVSLERYDGQAVLSVTDDGAGIPRHLQERVFERFARLDEARTTRGTGLGLAIARHAVVSSGGTLDIDPTHSPGARFVLRLPLAGEHSL